MPPVEDVPACPFASGPRELAPPPREPHAHVLRLRPGVCAVTLVALRLPRAVPAVRRRIPQNRRIGPHRAHGKPQGPQHPPNLRRRAHHRPTFRSALPKANTLQANDCSPITCAIPRTGIHSLPLVYTPSAGMSSKNFMGQSQQKGGPGEGPPIRCRRRTQRSADWTLPSAPVKVTREPLRVKEPR